MSNGKTRYTAFKGQKRGCSKISASPVPPEHFEQCALISWWNLQARACGLDEELLFAIPNGGYRSKAGAAKLRGEGVRSGVPDLFLAAPRKGKGGLFIEMKKQKGGKIGANQKIMLEKLRRQGFSAVIACGWEEASRIIRDYMGWSAEPAPSFHRFPMPWESWGGDTLGDDENF